VCTGRRIGKKSDLSNGEAISTLHFKSVLFGSHK
jgi:hypothetical protein